MTILECTAWILLQGPSDETFISQYIKECDITDKNQSQIISNGNGPIYVKVLEILNTWYYGGVAAENDNNTLGLTRFGKKHCEEIITRMLAREI
ncbi:MAG TPA: hypothetical protein PLK35_03835 [Candidatus Moranbacteria bacterium]|nr:hypothetical protein [Candidatus Moranbacteria bacterium]